jgi:hypothetical protein
MLWNRLDRLGDHVCNAQRSLKDQLVTSGFLLIKVHNRDPFARFSFSFTQTGDWIFFLFSTQEDIFC